MIAPGKYRHYKGGTYTVLFTAQCTNTNQSVVAYVSDEHGTYYVRPLKDFTAKVMQDSEDGGMPRFKRVHDKS